MNRICVIGIAALFAVLGAVQAADAARTCRPKKCAPKTCAPKKCAPKTCAPKKCAPKTCEPKTCRPGLLERLRACLQ